jgi:hypothetical protein
MIAIIILGILIIIGIIVNVFDVVISEGYDGYYLIWYRNYNMYGELHRIKYSKRIYKFKK